MRAHAAVCDVIEPWAHGTVVRATRYPSYFDYNLVRVEEDPGKALEDLVAFVADEALAGLEHRRVDFDDAAGGDALRPGLRGQRLEGRAADLDAPRAPAAARPGHRRRGRSPTTRCTSCASPGTGRNPPTRTARRTTCRRARWRSAARSGYSTYTGERPIAFAELQLDGDAAEISQVYVHPRVPRRRPRHGDDARGDRGGRRRPRPLDRRRQRRPAQGSSTRGWAFARPGRRWSSRGGREALSARCISRATSLLSPGATEFKHRRGCHANPPRAVTSHSHTRLAPLRLAALALALCLLGAAPARAGMTWDTVPGLSVGGRDARMTGALTPAQVAQGGVRLRLTLTGDACGTGWRATRFALDGATLPAQADAATACRFVSDPVAEGHHRLAAGGDAPQDIDVVRYVIASLGDSVASGEGNPDRRADLSKAQWQDARCHRSLRSGAALAAMAVERSSATSSVALLALGCSGATMPVGLEAPYAGIDPDRDRSDRGAPAGRPQRPGGPAGHRRGPAQHRCQRRLLLEHHRVLRALHPLPGAALRSAAPAAGGTGLSADARRRDRRRAAPARGSLRPAGRRDLRADPARADHRLGVLRSHGRPRRDVLHHSPGARHDRRPRSAMGAHQRGRGAERRRGTRRAHSRLDAGRRRRRGLRRPRHVRQARAAGVGAHAGAVLVLAGRARRPPGSPGRCTPIARATAPSRGASAPGWPPSCARRSATAGTTPAIAPIIGCSASAQPRCWASAVSSRPSAPSWPRGCGQAAVRPPSITSPEPVTKAAASEAR